MDTVETSTIGSAALVACLLAVAALAAAGVLGWAVFGERILVSALANGWATCF